MNHKILWPSGAQPLETPEAMDTAGQHPLDSWRLARGWTLEALAATLEVSTAAVSRYINGRRRPDPAVMQRIFALTEGAVAPNDFYRLPKNANGEGRE